MTFFVQASAALPPRTKEAKQISLMYAAVLVIFVVAQLFTYDEFIELVVGFGLPFSEGFVRVLVPVLISAELFALPFLLRMRLSIAFRWVSMVLGWLVAASWLFITSWLAVTMQPAETIGFLGTAVDLVPGWWAVFISLALCIMALWSSWGLWPGRRVK